MTKKRKRFAAEEKVRLLRLHLLEKVPVSDLCDEYGVNPNMFYRWQKQFFENGAAAFESSTQGRKGQKITSLEEKNSRLQAKLANKDEVIDYVRYWSDKTDIKATKMIGWINITRSKYYDWLNRYGIERSKEHAFVSIRHCRSTMPSGSSSILWSITTTGVCIVPSATLLPKLNFRAEPKPFWPNVKPN